MSEQNTGETLVKEKTMFFGPNCSVVLTKPPTADEESLTLEPDEDFNAGTDRRTTEIPMSISEVLTMASNDVLSQSTLVSLSTISTVRQGREGWRDHFGRFIDNVLAMIRRTYDKFRVLASPSSLSQTDL